MPTREVQSLSRRMPKSAFSLTSECQGTDNGESADAGLVVFLAGKLVRHEGESAVGHAGHSTQPIGNWWLRSVDLPRWLESVSRARVDLPRDRLCPLAEAWPKQAIRSSATPRLGAVFQRAVQAHDDQTIFCASPDELPVIDRHIL
jgi:hypothetical protein